MKQQHWNEVFAARADPDLGWYEADASHTLDFLGKVLPDSGADLRVFLPGAGTSVVVDALIERGYSLILNDISDLALDRLADRLSPLTGGENLNWLHHDIAKPLPGDYANSVDLWLDRAVLHFLLSEEDIRAYFANLTLAVKEEGYVMLAEFSTDGAPKCAGLEVHRYSLNELTERLGPGFQLLKSREHTYINPRGEERPYIYALFQKKSG